MSVGGGGWVNQVWGYDQLCLKRLTHTLTLSYAHARAYTHTQTNTSQDWIGGSALLWRHHHVLMHHAETNVDGDDPDITGLTSHIAHAHTHAQAI